ncbi:helix-turn-helix transcriptional regulator [Nocardia sp. NPDC003963]
MNSFVGRGPELDRIVGLLLSGARMITVVGPAGIGKTRLATEAIRNLPTARRTAVYWVRLTRLARGADADSVEEEVINSVVGTDPPAGTGWSALIGRLMVPGRTVLVMDNCEHVLTGAGSVIEELLESVAGLVVLATSRAAVGWENEYVITVPALTGTQASTLFRQRAELAGYATTDHDDVALVRSVCRHVDNNPLYIQLAAARLRREPLARVAEQLSGGASDRRLRWPHWPRTGTEPRQQGIRDAIAWSYDLCPEEVRLLLDRMSVFAAGFDPDSDDGDSSVPRVGTDLDAVEAVCSDDPSDIGPAIGLDAAEIENLLEQLVDQSLVTVHIDPTTVRYSLLESVRLFAAQQLRERSTEDIDVPEQFAKRHRRYYRDKIVALRRDWINPEERGVLAWVSASWDNLAKAVATSLAADEPALGLEISQSLILLPPVKASLREPRRWTLRALGAIDNPQPSTLEVTARAMVGYADIVLGDYESADRMLEECVTACLGDSEMRTNWRERPDVDLGLPPAVDHLWAGVLLFACRDPEAITVAARARKKFHACGDRSAEFYSSAMEAWAASFLGSPQQALGITSRHLELTLTCRTELEKGWAEMVRGIALIKYGDPNEALKWERRALADHDAAGTMWGELMVVHTRMWTLAQILRAMGAAGGSTREELVRLATEIAQLVGGTATLRAALGAEMRGRAGPYSLATEDAADAARDILGDKIFHAECRRGSLLSPERHEVQLLARGSLSLDRLPLDHPARQTRPSPWSDLSDAEQQVAVLAASGWTNSAIAARRGTSNKTVDAQMSAILRKLAIGSRADIRKLIPADRLARTSSEAARRRTGDRRLRASMY